MKFLTEWLLLLKGPRERAKWYSKRSDLVTGALVGGIELLVPPACALVLASTV